MLLPLHANSGNRNCWQPNKAIFGDERLSRAKSNLLVYNLLKKSMHGGEKLNGFRFWLTEGKEKKMGCGFGQSSIYGGR